MLLYNHCLIIGVLLINSNPTDARLKFDPEIDSNIAFKSSVECINSLKFKPLLGKLTLLSEEVETNPFAVELIKTLGVTVTLIRAGSIQPVSAKYVVFSTEVSFYNRLLEGITTESSALIIIIWTWSSFPNQNKTLEAIIEIIWTQRVFSLLVFTKGENNNVDVYSHFPYTENHCGKAAPPIYLDTWNTELKCFTTGFFDNFVGLLRDFHQCPLRVINKNRPPESVLLVENGLISFHGIGGKILKSLMKKYNFSITVSQEEDLVEGTYKRDKYGYVLSNYSKTNIVEAIKADKFDLAVGVFPFMNHFVPEVDLSYFYFTENFAFYVPCGTKASPSIWRYYYVEFSPPIWGMAVILFAIFLCFMKFLSKILVQENSSLSSFLGNAFIVWAIHLENTASFRTRSNSAKLFLTMVMFYCMIISVAYKASLKSFLMAPVGTNSIETWKELADSDFQIAGLYQDFNTIETLGKSNPLLKKLSKKYKTVFTGEFSQIIYNLTVKRNIAFFGSERMLTYYYSNLNEENGTTAQKICQVGEIVSSSPASSFLVRNGSPVRYIMDQLTIFALQSGEMKPTRKTDKTGTPVYSLTEKQEKFSLNHLKGTFFMWCIGMVIATISFLGESLYYFCNKNT